MWAKYRLPCACVLAVLAKLVLCAGMPLDVHAGATYDDVWAVRAADFICGGQWLGPYDDVTLIKNPGYPLWLALCSSLGCGYLLPAAVLYAAASAWFAVALRPLVRRDAALFALFVLVLFNPVSFATDTFQRLYRNSISAAQALLVFGSYIGCYLRIRAWGCNGAAGVGGMRGSAPGVCARTAPPEVPPVSAAGRAVALVPWMLVGALALAWLWLTREDGMWVVPFVLVATTVCMAACARRLRNAPLGLLCACVLLALPLAGTAGCVRALEAVNMQHYGVAVTAEINSGNFARMVKDLYAIDPAQLGDASVPDALAQAQRLAAAGAVGPGVGEGRSTGGDMASGGVSANVRVACTHAALLAACTHSPTLAWMAQEVEEQFAHWGDTVDNDPGDGEVNGGEFFWVLRRAAARSGVYAAGGWPPGMEEEARALMPAQFADAFYGRIADEIEACFADRSLPQRSVLPSSIMTPWRGEFAALLPGAFAGVAGQALACGDVTALPYAAQGSEEGISYFEQRAHAVAYRGGQAVPPACAVGEALVAVYRVLGPIVAVAGAACMALLAIRWVRVRMCRRKVRRERAGRAESALPGAEPGAVWLGSVLLVLFALVLGCLALVAGLSYSRVSSFEPIAYYYYGSALYPLLTAAGGLACACALQIWEGGMRE